MAKGDGYEDCQDNEELAHLLWSHGRSPSESPEMKAYFGRAYSGGGPHCKMLQSLFGPLSEY